MEMLLKLKQVARLAHDERDLPTDILAAVEGLTNLPAPGHSPLLATLLLQLEEYDPYAGCGCFGSGATPEALKETLARLGMAG